MRSKICMMLVSALAAVASSTAHADTVTVRSEVVRYDDLRLISNVGAAVLYGRLRTAAERACGVSADKRPIAHESRVRACVEDAVSKAVTEVNQPILTQYHETKRNRANQNANNSVQNGATVANAR